jgi:hypothetical protein
MNAKPLGIVSAQPKLRLVKIVVGDVLRRHPVKNMTAVLWMDQLKPLLQLDGQLPLGPSQHFENLGTACGGAGDMVVFPNARAIG